MTARSILSFTDFFLNLYQWISCCYFLHNQEVRPFVLLSCLSGPSEVCLSCFVSSLIFVKLDYLFFLKFSFGGCWCFFIKFWIKLILVNGLSKYLIYLFKQLSKVNITVKRKFSKILRISKIWCCTLLWFTIINQSVHAWKICLYLMRLLFWWSKSAMDHGVFRTQSNIYDGRLLQK